MTCLYIKTITYTLRSKCWIIMIKVLDHQGRGYIRKATDSPMHHGIGSCLSSNSTEQDIGSLSGHREDPLASWGIFIYSHWLCWPTATLVWFLLFHHFCWQVHQVAVGNLPVAAPISLSMTGCCTNVCSIISPRIVTASSCCPMQGCSHWVSNITWPCLPIFKIMVWYSGSIWHWKLPWEPALAHLLC